ncbi:hypothetical protein Tco_0086569 [Tanacetum coccineum]
MLEPVLESVPTVKESTLKSFASLVTIEAVTSKVNFRSLDSNKPINAKTEVKILKASILDVHSRFGFRLYSYFVGKIVAFPVVEYYTKNAWKKFGLDSVIMNSKGFFFFKFASIEGMNGVKFHDIPIVAITANGLSVMDTKLGKKVVQDVAGSASSNPNDGKLLKPCKATPPSSSYMVTKKINDLVNGDNDSEVEEVYDETTTFMASTRFNVNKTSISGSG